MQQPERSGVSGSVSASVSGGHAGPAGLDSSTAQLLRFAASSVIAACAVATLYFGRPVLLPFALATLLAFALAPLVGALDRAGFRRGPAVITTVALAVLVFASLAAFIGTQLSHLAPHVPRYQATLLTKIESIRDSAARSSLIRSATGVFDKFDNAIAGNPAAARPPRTLAAASAVHPVPVEVHPPNPGPLAIVRSLADPVLLPLARAALVIIFVIFILVQKEDLRDRFISLAGTRDLQRTALAIDEGAQRLSRYLLLQTSVNTCFGLFVACGLWLIGIPSAPLWGLLAGIARYVPYVGVPVAAVLPLTLALAVDPGWTMVIFTAVLFFGAEAITGQFIEPWLYGRHMGLSSIAVVLCAVFWTWIWGPLGLLLSTPLTMCMAVIGRNVERLRFLDILLGDRSALSPDEAFYFRMLAGNADEEAERADQLLKEISLTDYLDRVAIRGLVLAHIDEDRGALDGPGGDKIRAAVNRLLEYLSGWEGGAPDDEEEEDAASPARVLCVAGRGALDTAAAEMLQTVLLKEGVAARIVSAEATAGLRLPDAELAAVRVVCLSYLAPYSQKNARYLVRRLRKQLPCTVIVAGLWNDDQTDTGFLDAIEVTASDCVVTTLGDAAARIGAILSNPATARINPVSESRAA